MLQFFNASISLPQAFFTRSVFVSLRPSWPGFPSNGRRWVNWYTAYFLFPAETKVLNITSVITRCPASCKSCNTRDCNVPGLYPPNLGSLSNDAERPKAPLLFICTEFGAIAAYIPANNIGAFEKLT